jgi:transposase InsO family protein
MVIIFIVNRDGVHYLREKLASASLVCEQKPRICHGSPPDIALCLALRYPDKNGHSCALDYQRLLKQHGLLGFMSAKGNCYDNAPMESFWGSLKNELVHHRCYETRGEAEASIREYIEIFYNCQRRHSRLGHVAPAVFAQNFRIQQRAA